jgi:hypothetical protein
VFMQSISLVLTGCELSPKMLRTLLYSIFLSNLTGTADFEFQVTWNAHKIKVSLCQTWEEI